ncbi:MAG: ATP synthase F1 subunit delta [Acidobacteria bacterium]|nr:ATP synthase F1 subunit delta [Acidobacteriota bacterium]
MISSAVFARYARALADVALEGGPDARAAEDLALFGKIFEAVPDLLQAFDSPAVPREAKESLLAELLKRYPVGPLTANFLRVLLGHHRIRHYHEIHRLYTRVLNERKGIVAAKVRSAAPLSEEELETLRRTLSGITGKTVTLELETNPELLGGLIVRIGSTVYDGSVRNQLEEVRKSLAGA